MSDLMNFLLARIAEDEAGPVVDDAHESWCMDGSERLAPDGACFYCGHLPDPTMVKHVPQSARVLAECAAKRAIVAGWSDPMGRLDASQADAARAEKMRTLRLLAQPYVDHPDFREEWLA